MMLGKMKGGMLHLLLGIGMKESEFGKVLP